MGHTLSESPRLYAHPRRRAVTERIHGTFPCELCLHHAKLRVLRGAESHLFCHKHAAVMLAQQIEGMFDDHRRLVDL